MLKKINCVLTLALILGIPSQSTAANSCSISASGVNFGVYDPMAPSPNNSTGQVEVDCTTGQSVSYAIQLSAGNSNNYAMRKLLNGSSLLNYNLFTNAAHTIIWGNGASGSSQVSDSAKCKNKKTCIHTVYASIPALQTGAPIGTYSDNIVVTLVY